MRHLLLSLPFGLRSRKSPYVDPLPLKVVSEDSGDRIHDLDHFGFWPPAAARKFYYFEPQFDDFLNLTRVVYSYFWRFWLSFLMQKLRFQYMAGEATRNQEVFSGKRRIILMEIMTFSLSKQSRNIQRDCLGAKFWETPNPRPPTSKSGRGRGGGFQLRTRVIQTIFQHSLESFLGSQLGSRFSRFRFSFLMQKRCFQGLIGGGVRNSWLREENRSGKWISSLTKMITFFKQDRMMLSAPQAREKNGILKVRGQFWCKIGIFRVRGPGGRVGWGGLSRSWPRKTFIRKILAL